MDKIFNQPAPLQTMADSLNTIYRKEFSYAGKWAGWTKNPDTERVLALYHKLFSNPSGFNFVFTGDFDPLVMEELVLKYLGTIPTVASPVKQVSDEKSYASGGKAYIISKKQASGNHNINIQIYTESDTSLRARTERELLGNVLNAAILNRLRIKMGIAYTPVAFQKQISYDMARFVISFDTLYGDVDAGIKAVWEEIAQIKTTPLSEDKLQSIIAQELAGVMQQTSDYYWKMYFMDQFTYNRPANELTEWKKMLTSVTSADIARAARRYLTVESTQYLNQP